MQSFGFLGLLLATMVNAADHCSVNNTCANGVCFEGNCVCHCGYTGTLCTEKVQSRQDVYLVVYLAIFVVLGLVLGGLFYYLKKSDSRDFEQSCSRSFESGFECISPKVLFFFRLLAFLYNLSILLYNCITEQIKGDHMFLFILQYYTVWNYTFVVTFFGMGAYISFKGVFKSESNASTMSLVHKVHWVMMEVGVPSNFLVVVLTWVLLYPFAAADGDPSELVNFISFNQHGANALFMFIDFCLNNLFLVKWHALYLILWPTAYAMCHQVLTQIRDVVYSIHCPVYPFLAVTSYGSLVWFIMIIVIHLVFYGVFMLLSKAKGACTSKGGAGQAEARA